MFPIPEERLVRKRRDVSIFARRGLLQTEDEEERLTGMVPVWEREVSVWPRVSVFRVTRGRFRVGRRGRGDCVVRGAGGESEGRFERRDERREICTGEEDV